MSYAAEIVELSNLFFNDTLSLNEEAKEVLAGETVPQVLEAFSKQIADLEEFDVASIKASIKAVQKETGVKGKNLFMPIRVAVSGQMHGPELAETIMLLGKEKVLDHIKQATN